MTDLHSTRENLLNTLRYGCNPNAFPGSKDFWKLQEAKKALAEFDAAHPEVKAASEAKKPSVPDYKTDSNSTYSRALRGED